MNPQAMLGVSIFLNVFTLSVACLRFWILRGRRRTITERCSDIMFAVAVLISTTNVCGVCYKLMEEIKIRNSNTTTPAILIELLLFAPRFLKMVYIFAAAYILELYCLKAAFILFYWGLFKGMDWKRKAALYTTSVLVLLSFITTLLLFLLWCRPISKNWSSDLSLVVEDAALASSIVNSLGAWVHIATDILILALPLLILSTLRLRRPEILALVFVFCMGGLSISASVARYVIIYPYIKRPPLTSKTLSMLELWGIVEMAAAVFAFSLPCFRVMCVRFLESARTRNRGNSCNDNAHVGSNQIAGGGRRALNVGKNTFLDGNMDIMSITTTRTIGGGVVDRHGMRRSRAVACGGGGAYGTGRTKHAEKHHEGMEVEGVDEEDLELGVIIDEISEDAMSSGSGSEGGDAISGEGKDSQERLRPRMMGITRDIDAAAGSYDVDIRVGGVQRPSDLEGRPDGLVDFDFFPENMHDLAFDSKSRTE